MDSPYELILFGVAFCIFAMIVITVQARRKKDKTGYFVALIDRGASAMVFGLSTGIIIFFLMFFSLQIH